MKEPKEEIDKLAHQVIGAATEVHRHFRPGFLKSVYEEAFSIEVNLRGIRHERHRPVKATSMEGNQT